MEYQVNWTIDIDANSPEEAACLAQEIQRDPKSWATHFEVYDATGRITEVNLEGQLQPAVGQTVYVLVPMEEGIVRDVQTFRTADAAAAAEALWLLAKGRLGVRSESVNHNATNQPQSGRHPLVGMPPFFAV
jgi:hypothetical protein